MAERHRDYTDNKFNIPPKAWWVVESIHSRVKNLQKKAEALTRYAFPRADVESRHPILGFTRKLANAQIQLVGELGVTTTAIASFSCTTTKEAIRTFVLITQLQKR